ncbi:1788_t:CDS:1, partial [Scutellospora calospora]
NTQDKIPHIQQKSTHKRRIYNYNRMTKEKWEQFNKEVEQLINNTTTS